MSFRRDGENKHIRQKDWHKWKQFNADLLDECNLPIGVLRSRSDWEYLLKYGYWCEDYYGKYVGNIDFDLCELTPLQKDAFRKLLDRTLTADEKRAGSAAWHFVYPPPPPTK